MYHKYSEDIVRRSYYAQRNSKRNQWVVQMTIPVELFKNLEIQNSYYFCTVDDFGNLQKISYQQGVV